MDASKVDMYIMANQKYFPPEKMGFIRDALLSLDDNRFVLLTTVELKDPTTILIISIFLGTMGIDRFMIGDIGMGIFKLLTAGLCGIFTIIDWFLISNRTKLLNFETLMARLY